MIIVDRALRRLEEEGKPIRVAMIGAGFMARGIANQIINSVPGIRLAVIANRTLANAIGGFIVVPLHPVGAAIVTLLYYDLRIRREGYDIEMMAAGLGDGPSAGSPGDGAASAGEVGTGQPSF